MTYFTDDELRCKCGCGKLYFSAEALAKLNKLREKCGFPFIISSGYRCPEHPREASKEAPGEHSTGQAVDIVCNGSQAKILMKNALDMGVPRIGVNQRGSYSKRFIHIGFNLMMPPAFWSY